MSNKVQGRMMMKVKQFFISYFYVAIAFAGVSFEQEKKTSAPAIEKTADDVKKVLSTKDLSGVKARLRVEGAAFRLFNLYVPAIQFTATNAAEKNLANDVREIIDRDLKIVPGFNMVTSSNVQGNGDDVALVKQKGAEGVSKISIRVIASQIRATVEHKNLITGSISQKTFSSSIAGKRRLAHELSQSIYEAFIGPEDIFLLQIAAVRRGGVNNQIVLLDFDGHNETVVTQAPFSQTSPFFTPDGKGILYTAISPSGQGIVEQEIGSRLLQYRTKKPGINLDPRIIPDNSGMLMTLSFENNANIYRATRTGTILGKVTHGLGLNLSPTISPDGKEFAFVSDRSGSPQIYVQPLGAANEALPATRLTFQGTYNQTPHFSPDGKYIAFTGRDEKRIFDVFLLERRTARISRITENQGRNQEPYFTPSGRFVIFTSEREGKSKPDLFIASLNGDHQFRLTNANADPKNQGYFSPVVRPRPGAVASIAPAKASTPAPRLPASAPDR